MNLRQYIREHHTVWILVFLFAGLSHGTMLLSHSIGIDTEDMITLQDLFYGGWLETGRQGLVLLKVLTDTLTFNPYLAGAACLVFLTFACILWTYYFQSITGKENMLAAAGFSAVLLASTILTEQLYFKLQAMEISLGFCLLACNLILLKKACSDKKSHKKSKYRIYMYGIAIVLNLVLFSLYQVFVALFIFGTVAGFLLTYFYAEDKEEQESKALLYFLGVHIGIFLISFFLNQMLTSIFFSGSNYLTSQISWFSQPISVCLLSIYAHIRDVMTGNQIYYAKTFAVYVLIFLVMLVLFLYQNKERKAKPLAVLAMLALWLAPFYMTVLCGTTPVLRSQLVLPFTLGFMVYVTLQVADKKLFLYGALLLALATTYLQLRYTMQLNYTDSVRYEGDVRMASSMINDINELQREDSAYPVVFIGKQSAKLNNACIRGEVIGYSFFEWDTDIEPYGFFGTRRILGFMHTLGANYVQADSEQTIAAAEYSRQMPSWPFRGSIQLWNDMIVVKLSDCP